MFNELNKLINSDKSFKLNHRYTSDEIERFEKENDWFLPKEYKNLLTNVGAFEYEDDEYGSKFTFIELNKIKKWSEEVFRSYENLSPNILLIANATSGEEFGFIKGKDSLYVFNPESPCDQWLNEQMEKYEFTTWINLLIDSKFENIW